MDIWYDSFQSQCWYKNTFLINSPKQISRVNKGDREWNNIEGSGCHFVCLSMILGMNPAYLASKLAELNFFKIDRSLPSTKLDLTPSYLVWDKNEPYKNTPSITIDNVFYSNKNKLCDITINFLDIIETNNIQEANEIIKNHRLKGNHIICGYSDHSRLVSGVKNKKYFLWDPDLTETNIADNISGTYDLNWFYNLYSTQKEYTNRKAEYWIYSIDILEKIKRGRTRFN